MKSPPAICAFIILIALMLWFAFHRRQPSEQREQSVETNANIASTVTTRATSVIPKTSATNGGGVANNLSTSAMDPGQGAINKAKLIQQAILEENKKSLDLYGKVIDQFGQPVVGAKVEGSILLNVSFVASGGETHSTETDSTGCFNFLGVHGVKIGISPEKAGYYYNQKQPSQRPENYYPDPSSPLVFTMWRIQGPEKLVDSSIDANISTDGAPEVFDISSGSEVSEGNFRVTLTRSPHDVERGKFDWKLKIEAIGGGLIAENDTYPYWAPSTGYQPSFLYEMSSNNIPWRNNLEQGFYIKTSQGQYGRVQFGISSGLTPARLQVSFTINPSGSMDLEPDFLK